MRSVEHPKATSHEVAFSFIGKMAARPACLFDVKCERSIDKEVALPHWDVGTNRDEVLTGVKEFARDCATTYIRPRCAHRLAINTISIF